MLPYGFAPNDEGFALFASYLNAHEANEEFKTLSNEFKGIIKAMTTFDEDEV